MKRRTATIWRYGLVLLRHRALMLSIPALAAAVAAVLSLSAPRESVAPASRVKQGSTRAATGFYAADDGLAPFYSRKRRFADSPLLTAAEPRPKRFEARSRSTLRTVAAAGILAAFFAAALSFLLEYTRIARVHSAEAYREFALLRPRLRTRGLD